MESSDEDSQAIANVLAGNPNAFRPLVEAYETRIRGFCSHLLGDSSLGEDAAQEVFVKAYRNLNNYRAEASFYTWLYRIAVNHCRDMLRKQKRETAESWDKLIEENGEAFAYLMQNPNDMTLAIEQQELIKKILASLTPTSREVVILREVEDLNYEEMATALNCSINAIKGRLKRARMELARLEDLQ